MELRYIGTKLDEVVARGFVHVEQMDTGTWYIGIETDTGSIKLYLESGEPIEATVTESTGAKKVQR